MWGLSRVHSLEFRALCKGTYHEHHTLLRRDSICSKSSSKSSSLVYSTGTRRDEVESPRALYIYKYTNNSKTSNSNRNNNKIKSSKNDKHNKHKNIMRATILGPVFSILARKLLLSVGDPVEKHSRAEPVILNPTSQQLPAIDLFGHGSSKMRFTHCETPAQHPTNGNETLADISLLVIRTWQTPDYQ